MVAIQTRLFSCRDYLLQASKEALAIKAALTEAGLPTEQTQELIRAIIKAMEAASKLDISLYGPLPARVE